MLQLILFVLAAISFGLAAFRVNGPVDWTNTGFCLLTIALFII